MVLRHRSEPRSLRNPQPHARPCAQPRENSHLDWTHRGQWILALSGAVCALAFIVAIPLPRIDDHLIGSDGVRYYAITRSIVLDGDFDFRNDFELLNEPIHPTRTGLADNAQSIGTGLLWIPFFILAHLLALGLGATGLGVVANGLGYLYEASVCLGTVVYATVGFVLTYRVTCYVLGRVSGRSALLSTLAMWWATSAIYYVVAEPSMSHGVTVFTMALFFYWWKRPDEVDTEWRWARLGFAVGLATLVRAQDGVIALIPIGELAWRAYRRMSQPSQLLRQLAVFGLVVALCVTPQLAMWRVMYGSLVTIPQGSDFFAWAHPHIVETLFSTRHGLISWHPVYLVAMCGLFPLFRLNRAVAGAVALVFLAELYVNSAAVRWWADDAFGGRRFVSLVPWLTVPLATLFERSRRGWAPLALVSALVLWNGMAFVQYRFGFVSKSDALTLKEMTIERLLLPVRLARRLLQ